MMVEAPRSRADTGAMPPHRIALPLLILLACLLVAAPAGASERSESRKYAAAMQPRVALTPEQAEALVADIEARAAQVAATCLPAIRAAAEQADRALVLALVYLVYSAEPALDHVVSWSGDADARLAAIDTRSRVLRRARAARRALTRTYADLVAAAPADFCASVTGWEAKGWKGEPPGTEALSALLEGPDVSESPRLKRGARLLRRHGATRRQVRAFNGTPSWPKLREPAPDPVVEALLPSEDRESPDDAPGRTPYAAPGGW